jgi:hypothetical protein
MCPARVPMLLRLLLLLLLLLLLTHPDDADFVSLDAAVTLRDECRDK